MARGEEDAGVDQYQLREGIVIHVPSARKLEGDRGEGEYRRPRKIEPLNEYLNRSLITEQQFRAGKKLAMVYHLSSHVHRPVQFQYREWCPAMAADHERQFQMSEAYVRAIRAIRTARGQEVARVVCCESMSAGKRGAMTVLRDALDDLVRHFEIR